MNDYKLLIDGQWVEGACEPFKVTNPATLETVATCANGTTEQLDLAVQAAQRAFKSWQHVSHEERKAILHRIADEIAANRDELAALIVAEQGKPFNPARAERPEGAGWMLVDVEFIDEGQVTSVNDIVTEMTFSFIACDFKPFSYYDIAASEEAQQFLQNDAERQQQELFQTLYPFEPEEYDAARFDGVFI